MNWTLKISTLLIALMPVTVLAADPPSTSHQEVASHGQATVKADQPLLLQRSGENLGKKVYSTENKKIGLIVDMVIDGQQNRVSYAAISFGSYMGMGDQYFLVPWAMLEHRLTQPDRAYLHADLEKMKKAPTFDKSAWPDFASLSYRSAINSHYGYDPNAPEGTYRYDPSQSAELRNFHDGESIPKAAPRSRDRMNQPDQKASDNSKNNEPAKGNVSARRASGIIGAVVMNPQKEEIGSIRDLIIDSPTGRVKYAVLAFADVMGMGTKLYPLPAHLLHTADSDKGYVLEMSHEDIKKTTGFDDSNWPDWNEKLKSDSSK